jgi:hypothetical protein
MCWGPKMAKGQRGMMMVNKIWGDDMNDKFDKWLRDAIPNVPEDRVKQEIHLAILKERMRDKKTQRRRWALRWSLIGAPVLLAVLLVGNVVELGGDSFDLVEHESELVGKYVANEFRGVGFNVYEDQTDKEIQEFNQQIAAGEGIVVGLDGWIIDGVETWSILREYNVLGEIIKAGMASKSKPERSRSDVLKLINFDWELLEAKMESDEYQLDGTEEMAVDGMLFFVERYSFLTEEYGRVVHYEGKVISAVNMPKGSATSETTSIGSVKAMFR